MIIPEIGSKWKLNKKERQGDKGLINTRLIITKIEADKVFYYFILKETHSNNIFSNEIKSFLLQAELDLNPKIAALKEKLEKLKNSL